MSTTVSTTSPATSAPASSTAKERARGPKFTPRDRQYCSPRNARSAKRAATVLRAASRTGQNLTAEQRGAMASLSSPLSRDGGSGR